VISIPLVIVLIFAIPKLISETSSAFMRPMASLAKKQKRRCFAKKYEK